LGVPKKVLGTTGFFLKKGTVLAKEKRADPKSIASVYFT
jgi:hypothetical protein